MFAEFMNLDMAVVTAGNAIVGSCILNLIIFVGPVWVHLAKIFFARDGFDHISQVGFLTG
jgi:hypothetical protein